ncbi:MAG: hypothetical protein DHS80DRAFT_29688 [Piptocephalis tieghemiana]|nr:MAG: hypothetical protein DHS80DRAFT_29688 [Piptocephalis tieghemiana]
MSGFNDQYNQTFSPNNNGGGGGGGGGFFTSPYGNSQGASQSPSTRKSGPPSQSLHTLTIKQLQDAVQPQADLPFRVDNHDLSNVSIIGVVRNENSYSMYISYTLEDGTGSIDVQLWGPNDDPENQTQNHPTVVVGTYVRVIGNLRATGNKRSIRAHTIRPINDPNLITQHFLKCIFIHLHFSRGPPPSKSGNAGPMGPSASGFPSGPSMGMGDGMGGGAMADPTDRLNATQRQVLTTVKANASQSDGMHIQDITRHLGLPVSVVRDAVKALTDDGLLYATIDDDHVNVTDPN